MKNIKKIFLLLAVLFSVVQLHGRTLYITRHGQVGDPACKAPNGERALTPLGTDQARQLGEYLKQKKFSGTIYVSPLYRTLQTAMVIAGITGSPVLVDPGLQEYSPVLAERNSGKYGICNDGMDFSEISKYFPVVSASRRFAFPWRVMNEPAKMRHERCAKTLDAILDETAGDVLLVGHSATVKSLIYTLSERLGENITAIPWNCCLLTVTLDGKGQISGYTVETGKFQKPEQITNNFRKPLIPKPGDKRYQ
ncbi:MAG: histidine phosphatase family protein [Lentisphaeria bacterium]|nr:histidine phosphatase family protein [Lentisphaeria bacterium]